MLVSLFLAHIFQWNPIILRHINRFNLILCNFATLLFLLFGILFVVSFKLLPDCLLLNWDSFVCLHILSQYGVHSFNLFLLLLYGLHHLAAHVHTLESLDVFEHLTRLGSILRLQLGDHSREFFVVHLNLVKFLNVFSR